MMLVGTGAVGQCIVELLLKRDPEKEWFTYCLLSDINEKHAQDVFEALKDDRLQFGYVDATQKEMVKEEIQKHNIDFVMDASSPFCANVIFDAACECHCRHGKGNH